jgi:RHS repeat-associated protein
MDGPYSQGYDYDVWGNVTHKYGWGGEVQGDNPTHTPPEQWPTYSGNRRTDGGFVYDAAGNEKNDGTQTFLYDATGQQTYASGLGAGGSAPTFTDDPLVSQVTVIKLEHLTELRMAVNQLRARAGLAPATWSSDPDPQRNVTTVKADHIRQLRTKLEEALNALHLPIGGYTHPTLTENSSLIYAIDFQELRKQIKDAWTALASTSALNQAYDGDGLRVKKTEYGWTTFYLRSSVLGGQVLAEIDGNNVWQRGYVYAGGNLMAVQQSGVFWMHEDPVTKSKRTTDANGNVVSAIELDPWGADTSRSSSAAFQPTKYTSYDRDGNGSDEAMFRRYNRKHSRFDQPDPYEGSYDFTNPQSFNRYAYVLNDPANFVDPSGLNLWHFVKNLFRDRDKDRINSTPDLLFDDSQWWAIGYTDEYRYDHATDPQNSAPHGPAHGQTLSQADCDKKIAAIFGGPGAVAATVNEPSTLQHPSAGRDRYDHLAGNGVFHLYTNAQGTEATVGLYAPPGFTGRPATGTVYQGENDPHPGEVNYNYERFTYRGGLQISFVHAGNPGVNPNDRNAMGSIRVGNIGGPGGEGSGYNHTHVNVYLNGKRADPRSIFCK